MKLNIMDWTHKKISITDIRKINKFYILNISDKNIDQPLFVDHGIFEARLKAYYLSDSPNFDRIQVMSVKWNMVITEGCFVKINKDKNIEKILKDADKFYISFLEIDGPLGTHI